MNDSKIDKYQFIVVGGGIAGTTCIERVKPNILISDRYFFI